MRFAVKNGVFTDFGKTTTNKILSRFAYHCFVVIVARTDRNRRKYFVSILPFYNRKNSQKDRMNARTPLNTSEKKGVNRRRFLKIGAAAAIISTAYYFGAVRTSGLKSVKHSLPMMGTTVNMTVCGRNETICRNAIETCIARMESLSSMMSTYVPDSPLSLLNRDGVLENAPRELVEVFTVSREISELSDGAFDPTIKPLLAVYEEVRKTGRLPEQAAIERLLKLVDYRHIIVENSTIKYTVPGTQATLGGIAKGYIVDQGIAELKKEGITNAFVEAGGDLVTIGKRPDGKRWKIGIRNPRSGDLAKMDTIELSGKAIATSGDYMQYFTDDKKIHHIINPKTGFSPVNTASSSIIAPTLAKADGLATATMVLGPEAATELIETLPDCEGYFFDKKLKKYHTSGFFS